MLEWTWSKMGHTGFLGFFDYTSSDGMTGSN